MHWGWYWKVKKLHTPKTLCSDLIELDSFELFKNKELLSMFIGKIIAKVPMYTLDIIYNVYQCTVSFNMQNGQASYYHIPIEKKPCNYGGHYYFFKCPLCTQKMRKLYCSNGFFACRKCLRLGYLTQRLRPSDRYLFMSYKIEQKIKSMGGDVDKKPPRIKRKTYSRLWDLNFYYLYVKYKNSIA